MAIPLLIRYKSQPMHCLRSVLTWALLVIGLVAAWGQTPRRWTPAELHQAIEKLNFLGSALYVAAHPDDENTRLISYLANEVKAHTAYLSLTRGDGGQNLIGPEIRELLGVIRTQELLAARRTDGGNQLFTRANDYGFSKHPNEAFATWDSVAVLSDVVWAIRSWQPDVVINRFDHRSPGSTHGHHTASGMLSFTAFDLAGRKDVFPEQLQQQVAPWQPQRLFFNTSWWFYGSQEKFDAADKSRMAGVDVGVYYPALGYSNPEIAARSRTQHKSQGFGSTGSRGSEMEYLELLKGDMPTDKGNLFEGINTTWTRVPGGGPIGEVLAGAARDFDFRDPARSLPALMRAYALIKALPDSYWKRVKQAEIAEVIRGCAGLFLEVVANDYSATPGQTVTLKIEAINRSQAAVSLLGFSILPMGQDTTITLDMPFNKRFQLERSLSLPANMPLSNSFWLNEPFTNGMYNVPDQRQRNLGETPRQFRLRFRLRIAGEIIELDSPVVYKRNDSVDGEVYRPFEVTPPAFLSLDEGAYVFADNQPRTVSVKVTAGKPNLAGALTLQCGPNWRVEPATQNLSFERKGEEQTFRFTLYPPSRPDDSFITPIATVDGRSYDSRLVTIAYDHIPTQLVFLNAKTRTVRLELERDGDKIGYLMGAGDEIPAALRQIGYDVTELADADMTPDRLATFDAVVLGVRAYNTVDKMPTYQPLLLRYVENGGVLVVQYNTNRELRVPANEIAPYEMTIGRDRVTIEEAEMRFLAPAHPALNKPNAISARDFDGWVQERGLYYVSKWGPEFTAILSSNDPGEAALDGGLLVARHGKGHYVYTGLAFFRQLPAGVPGAFRLFANLLGLGSTAP